MLYVNHCHVSSKETIDVFQKEVKTSKLSFHLFIFLIRNMGNPNTHEAHAIIHLQKAQGPQKYKNSPEAAPD